MKPQTKARLALLIVVTIACFTFGYAYRWQYFMRNGFPATRINRWTDKLEQWNGHGWESSPATKTADGGAGWFWLAPIAFGVCVWFVLRPKQGAKWGLPGTTYGNWNQNTHPKQGA